MPPEVVENFQIIGDGAEQARQRAGDGAEQKVSYAGKKKLPTDKTQVLGTPTGLILGLSASAGGSVDDFKQWKGFRFHDGFKRILGLMGDRVRGYCESAYQSIDNGIRNGRCADNKKLSATSRSANHRKRPTESEAR